ncbi:MAG: SLC13 family permease [Anaerolineales bacterium]
MLVVILVVTALVLAGRGLVQSQENTPPAWIVGKVLDEHDQPLSNVNISLVHDPSKERISSAETYKDGRYALPIPESLPADALLVFDRPHFQQKTSSITERDVQSLSMGRTVSFPTIKMERKITPAFWIATAIFLGVLILIATGYLHNTLATFAGASLILAISYLGPPLKDGLFIFGFHQALEYIDWNVIFLVMGMMIVIAVVENTGIFRWLAYFAYRISQERMWVLLTVLMLITGVASAFLDNVTTMLLMTPITVQIAIALGISPIALLMPEIFASNVIGVSTLIGTPTNIIIGSFAQITFSDFLTNLTPGVLLAFAGLVLYSWLSYRSELSSAKTESKALLDKLEERAKITNPENLRKAGLVGTGMLLLFIFGERFHLLPAVTALLGASMLLVWIKPDVEEMIEAVDWTTLVFFMSLFIVVGAIQEVGLISFIASAMGNLVGESLVLTMMTVTWMSALFSMVVANIPFTTAMLPVVAFLSTTVPGADNKVLYYCLSVGAAMGGNGSLIGASANMITAGIAQRAGYKITYGYFLKKGFPALLITVLLSMLWLFLRFY